LSTPTPAPLISPVEAAREAYHHTVKSLFPFRFEAWLVLGLVAFLEECGRGGMGGAVPGGPGNDVPLGKTPFPEIGGWLSSHVALLMAGAAVALLVMMGLVALALWIGSRATFVYVDDVAHGRAELVRPWREHAAHASSYFAWRLALALVLVVAVLVLLGLGLLAALGLTEREAPWHVAAAVALVAFIPVFLVILLGSGVLSLALRDFVAPLQVQQDLTCRRAAELLVVLVRNHPMVFFVYVVLKVVFGVLRGTLLLAAACATCCCILIPVVTQTFLQPLFFFERAWSLCLLRQLGYDIFVADVKPVTRPPAIG
jgi:hypothetical protein